MVVGWLLLLIFVVLVAAIGGVERNVRLFQLAYLIGFAGFLILVRVVLKAQSKHLGSWPWWIVGAVVLRVILIQAEPSDDVYRYVWEGRIQLAGFNPYELSPDDPILEHLRDDDWAKINHRDYPAIYPPVAQMTFLFVTWIWPSVLAIKVFLVLADLLTIAVLGSCLRAMKLPPHRAMIYGLCPLVLSSIAMESHLDSLMLLLAVTCIRLLMTKYIGVAAVFLGLSISTKLVLVVLVPWIMFRSFKATLVVLIAFSLTYVPYCLAGWDLVESLRRFGQSGEFFSLLGTLGLVDFDTFVERGLVGGVIVFGVLSLARREHSFSRYASDVVGLLLLLMPIVHAWYLTWAICFCVFRARMCWLFAACAMVVYYEAQQVRVETGVWDMPAWAPMVVWGAFGAGSIIDAMLSRRNVEGAQLGVG